MELDKKPDLSAYQEIRGKLIRKKRSLFGKYFFYISNGEKTVSVIIGKGAWHLYDVGSELTVGYIGHMLINIRPGIVGNEDE